MDVISLNQKFVRDLIETYKNLPALWKLKSQEYRSKTSKAEAYEILLRKCREYVHDADKEFVRNKINSLRTSFRKEYKKVLTSKLTALRPNEVYKPHLWYYDLIKFTVDQENESNDKDDAAANTIANEGDANSNSFQEGLYFKEEENYLSSAPTTPEEVTTFIPEKTDSLKIIPAKRQRLDDPESKQKNFDRQEDIFDAIGRNVAHKLRGMDNKQRIIAEKIISDIMYHGQMEMLTVNSHLTVNSKD